MASPSVSFDITWVSSSSSDSMIESFTITGSSVAIYYFKYSIFVLQWDDNFTSYFRRIISGICVRTITGNGCISHICDY